MIYHLYSRYVPSNSETSRRMRLARRTWDTQPWKDFPIDDSSIRMLKDQAGSVPFIKDLFKVAVKDKSLHDIMVFTNSDICVSTHCSYIIAAALQGSDAGYCFRRDFKFLNTPIPNELIQSGEDYIGCDLFTFRVSWWLNYSHAFPDMLLGREAWDCVLRVLMDWTNDARRSALPDLIYHEKHRNQWADSRYRYAIPSQLHNLRLAKEWLKSYRLDYSRFGIK